MTRSPPIPLLHSPSSWLRGSESPRPPHPSPSESACAGSARSRGSRRPRSPTRSVSPAAATSIYYEAEGGSPSPELLARIAQVLGVSTDVLATGSGAPRAKAQPPIENLRLLRRLKRLQELPPHDQKAVLRMIDMMADARSRAS